MKLVPCRSRIGIAILFFVTQTVQAGVFVRLDTPAQTANHFGLTREANDSRSGAAVHGVVVERKVFPCQIEGIGAMEYTLLRIQVRSAICKDQSLNKGEILAVHLGGTRIRTSAQPPAGQTAVGREALFFLRKDPQFSPVPGALLLEGDNSIFPIQESSAGRKIVLGKGPGMPVRANEFLDESVAAIRTEVDRAR